MADVPNAVVFGAAQVGSVRPLLLDLFCGAGGAAMGYYRAGFDVVGVDIAPQPRYPFEFHQADALEFLWSHKAGWDVIHASPPCQVFTRARQLAKAQGHDTKKLGLVSPTRELLKASGVLYVIENVEGAPLLEPVTLCGSSFGLKVRRHRLFESNVALTTLECRHKEQGRPVGVYHRMGDSIPQGGRTARTLEEGQEAMGIDWMTWNELKEAVPPDYTEHSGHQLLRAVEYRKAA